MVEILLSAREPAGDDLGVGIVNRASQWSIFEVLKGNDVPGLRVSEGLFDLRGVDPVVAVEDSRAWFDDKSGHGGSGIEGELS